MAGRWEFCDSPCDLQCNAGGTTRRHIPQVSAASVSSHGIWEQTTHQSPQIVWLVTGRDWQHVSGPDESRYQLFAADGTVRVWCRTYEVMDPSFQQGPVRAGGGSTLVWGVFS